MIITSVLPISWYEIIGLSSAKIRHGYRIKRLQLQCGCTVWYQWRVIMMISGDCIISDRLLIRVLHCCSEEDAASLLRCYRCWQHAAAVAPATTDDSANLLLLLSLLLLLHSVVSANRLLLLLRLYCAAAAILLLMILPICRCCLCSCCCSRVLIYIRNLYHTTLVKLCA